MTMTDLSEVPKLVIGAVDCWVHANPDLLVRRVDDVHLARDSASAGLAAVIHRHHWGSTAERSALARDITGFPILGAVLLNDSVGGLNPAAVELALEMGARWIGLPTISARPFRERMSAFHPSFFQHLKFAPGRIEVRQTDGSLRPEMLQILRLVRAGDAVLNLGYVGNDEMLAVARAAAELGLTRLVLTNAHLSDYELEAVLAIPGFFFEVTSYGTHPEGLGGTEWAAGLRRNVELIRNVGVERVILSSDGGMAGAPAPAEILRWALSRYAEAGFSVAELRALVQTNPRRLLPEDAGVPAAPGV
jgi:Family of unknown function (DUF6282)